MDVISLNGAAVQWQTITLEISVVLFGKSTSFCIIVSQYSFEILDEAGTQE